MDLRPGKVTVIVGPMYSGKTTELLTYAEIYEIGRKRVMLFKPKLDVRYSDHEIVTHKLFKVGARAIEGVDRLLEFYRISEPKPDAVFIDEAHFFESRLAAVVKEISLAGTDVYCAGLDLNYLWEPFETTALLMALADEVIKKKAVCEICGEYTATLSHKKLANGNVIDVGGKEKYIAVCKTCYQSLAETSGVLTLRR